MTESSFQAVCEASAERHDVPALAAGYLLDGRVETAGSGASAWTRFRVASVTKPFTATLAAAHLELDSAVPVWPGTQVRHLLAHTSGYEGERGDLARFGEGDDALARLVAELPGQRRLLPAGEAWSYCNAGYWIAGHLAAERAGSSYEDALADHVIGPARLEATAFDRPDVPGHVLDESTGERTEVEGVYPRARRAGGGLVSSVSDLLRFAAWQLDGAGMDALRVPVVDRPGGRWGLGFSHERVGDVELWGHPGSAMGFQSSLLLAPARGFAFVGLTNTSVGSLALREVEGHVLEHALGVRRERPATVELARAELELLAGRYANPEVDYAVAAERETHGIETIRVERSDGPPFVGHPIGGREFLIAEGYRRDARFDFLPATGPPRFLRDTRLAERL